MQNKIAFLKFRLRLFLFNYVFKIRFSLFSFFTPIVSPILYSTILFFIIRGNDFSNYDRFGYVFTGFFFLRYASQSIRFIIAHSNINSIMNGYTNDFQKILSLFLTSLIEQFLILTIMHIFFSGISIFNYLNFCFLILISNLLLIIISYVLRIIYLNFFSMFRKVRLLIEFIQPALMFILPIFWMINENTATFLLYAFYLIPYSIPLELLRLAVFNEFQNDLLIYNFYFLIFCITLSVAIIFFKRRSLLKLKNSFDSLELTIDTLVIDVKKFNYLISKLHLYFFISNTYPIYPYKPNNLVNFRISDLYKTLNFFDKINYTKNEKRIFSSASAFQKKEILVRIYSYLNPPIKINFKHDDNYKS